MASVTESITVDRPISTVYNQWTEFEEFPRFMEAVEAVSQTDDTHLHWVAAIGGKRHEWDAEITEQRPDEVVSWPALDGHYNSGRVLFEKVGQVTTKVTVEMEHEIGARWRRSARLWGLTVARSRVTSSGSRSSSSRAAPKPAAGAARSTPASAFASDAPAASVRTS